MSDTKTAPIQTILCAHDFSETSDLALKHALRLVRRHGARLVLAHVVEPIPLGPYPVLIAPENELAVRDLARQRIEKEAVRLRGEGVIVDVRVDMGRPGPQLVEIAEDEGADLFVIGTRGLTGFKHVLLGSTAEYVVRRSSCPVITIHPEDSLSEREAEVIVLPTDLSRQTTRATDVFSAVFYGGTKPKILLVYADRTPPYLEPFRHDTLMKMNQPDIMKENIERKMQGSVDHLRAAGFEVETAVLDGDPVSVVTEFARERKADLIVMNTHGRSAFVNAILGKTAQRIVQHAPCPVLTVRP